MEEGEQQEEQQAKEPDFMVEIMFSDAARAHLDLDAGPPKKYPRPVDLLHLRHVKSGDFLRMQGIADLWVVQQRVWHLMADQTVLKLVLDGPIAEGG